MTRQQLTYMNQPVSSPVTRHVVGVELQSKNQGARYDHAKMYLWFGIFLTVT